MWEIYDYIQMFLAFCGTIVVAALAFFISSGLISVAWTSFIKRE